MVRGIEEEVAFDVEKGDGGFRGVGIGVGSVGEAAGAGRGVEGLGAAEEESNALGAVVAAPGAGVAVGHSSDARERGVRERRIEKLGDVDAPLIGGGLGALEDAGARVEVLGMDAGEETRGGGAAAGGALGFGGERDGEGTSATTGSRSTRSGRARGGGSHTLEDGAGDGRGAGGDAEPSNHGTHRRRGGETRRRQHRRLERGRE